MDLSYSYSGPRYNPEEDAGSYRTGVWGSTDIWDMPTEVLSVENNYSAIKDIILAADWDAIAELLSDSRMHLMKARMLRKVLQNDPQVNRAFNEFIRVLDSASEDAIIFG